MIAGQRRTNYNVNIMLDLAIRELQSKHPWMLYEEAFALMVDSYNRHKSEQRFSGMNKALMKIDFGIFLREDRNKLMNRLAVIQEFI